MVGGLSASAAFLCLSGGALCLPLPKTSHEALTVLFPWQSMRPSMSDSSLEREKRE